MQEAGKEDILIMSAGPYKNCSCMSAYSVDAQKMADAVGMVCWADDSDVRFFTQILFHEDTLDPFYSEQNMASIHKSIQQINDGKIVSKTIDELEQMENN